MAKTTYALAALNHGSIKDTKVINLRVTTNRKPKYKSLRINVKAKNWDQKNQRVKGGLRGEPNADIINEKIQKILLKAQTEETVNVGKRENSFIDYAKYIIGGTHTHGTKQNRYRAIKKLEAYLEYRGLNDLPFTKLDNIFVEGYYSWLMMPDGGGLAISTANEYMQILDQVVDKTILSGKHHFQSHPFIGHRRKKTDNLLEVLDDTDLKKLIEYSPRTIKQKQAKSIFFLMMHLSGIRISDMLTLTFNNFFVDNEGRLMVRYKTQKSSRVVTTRVNIEAALEITHFLLSYRMRKQISDFFNTNFEYSKLRGQLRKTREEFDNTTPLTLDYIYRSWTEDPEEDKMWLLKREAETERKKEHLRLQVIYLEEKMLDLKTNMMNSIATIMMEIKKNHPNDTILPHMRGIYKGEDRMSPEVESICNNFKTKNNQTLKRIAKKVGIKKKISNHQARHVFAMKLFLRGVNMHYISLALGHSNISTTDKYRQKLIDDRLHDVTDEFSETFKDLSIWGK